MIRVKTIKIEWSKDTPEVWIYIGAGDDRKEILKLLKSQITNILGNEGFMTVQDSPGLPSPILKIIYWTKEAQKLKAINEIVREFQKEGINVKVG